MAGLTNAPKPPDCGGNRPAWRPEDNPIRRSAPVAAVSHEPAGHRSRPGLRTAIAVGLDAADEPVVLLQLPDTDERTLLNGVKAVTSVVQNKA